MHDTLVTWLRTQLDDDERAARAAAALCGCDPAAPRWEFADDEHEGRIVITDHPHPAIRHQLTRRWNRSYPDMFAARHIVRWDPAHVLAEVEAKRRLLELHCCAGILTGAGYADGGFTWCTTCGGGGPNEYPTEWPCPTLRLLVLPYAGRAGWREEWRS
jgi:hypothetical protein